MHSHDRTMLAGLGFADPDKKNDLHDAACRYMATKESFDKLVDRFLDRGQYLSPSYSGYHIDAHIAKGEGQYRTTIGFADVVLEGVRKKKSSVESLYGKQRPCRSDCREECGGGVTHLTWHDAPLRILVEVKIGQVPVGDIIRQLGLYRSYFPANLIVAACVFPLVRGEIESLKNEKIRYVRLGSGLDEFMKSEDQARIDEDFDF